MSAHRVKALLPLYLVVFVGFVGYSLMIAVLTPMILRNENGMLAPGSSLAHRSVLLGVLLALYPLGQFFGSPVLGALSDRYGRRLVLITSLCGTTTLYAGIATALAVRSLALLMVSWFGYPTAFWAVAILLCGVLIGVIAWLPDTRAGAPGGGYLDAFTNLSRIVTDRRLRPLYLVNFTLQPIDAGWRRGGDRRRWWGPRGSLGQAAVTRIRGCRPHWRGDAGPPASQDSERRRGARGGRSAVVVAGAVDRRRDWTGSSA